MISSLPLFVSIIGLQDFAKNRLDAYSASVPSTGFAMAGSYNTSYISYFSSVILLLALVVFVLNILVLINFKNTKRRMNLAIALFIVFCIQLGAFIFQSCFAVNYIRSSFNGHEILNGFYKIPFTFNTYIYSSGIIFIISGILLAKRNPEINKQRLS